MLPVITSMFLVLLMIFVVIIASLDMKVAGEPLCMRQMVCMDKMEGVLCF